MPCYSVYVSLLACVLSGVGSFPLRPKSKGKGGAATEWQACNSKDLHR